MNSRAHRVTLGPNTHRAMGVKSTTSAAVSASTSNGSLSSAQVHFWTFFSHKYLNVTSIACNACLFVRALANRRASPSRHAANGCQNVDRRATPTIGVATTTIYPQRYVDPVKSLTHGVRLRETASRTDVLPSRRRSGFRKTVGPITRVTCAINDAQNEQRGHK
uniref:Uncharacterized protein n=1 Tax=Romanomermis culicivorax TaxID=13658 RepID=A0A915L229_ROMCU